MLGRNWKKKKKINANAAVGLLLLFTRAPQTARAANALTHTFEHTPLLKTHTHPFCCPHVRGIRPRTPFNLQYLLRYVGCCFKPNCGHAARPATSALFLKNSCHMFWTPVSRERESRARSSPRGGSAWTTQQDGRAGGGSGKLTEPDPLHNMEQQNTPWERPQIPTLSEVRPRPWCVYGTFTLLDTSWPRVFMHVGFWRLALFCTFWRPISLGSVRDMRHGVRHHVETMFETGPGRETRNKFHHLLKSMEDWMCQNQ